MNDENSLKEWKHNRPSRFKLALFLIVILAVSAAFLAYQCARTKQLLSEDQKHLIEITGQQLRSSRQLQQSNQLLAILLSDKTQKFALESSGTGKLGIQAYVNMRLGIAILGSDVPIPRAGHTYQLWGLSPREYWSNSYVGFLTPQSPWLFQPAPDGTVMYITDPPVGMESVVALFITEEPLTGSPKPDSQELYFGGEDLNKAVQAVH